VTPTLLMPLDNVKHKDLLLFVNNWINMNKHIF